MTDHEVVLEYLKDVDRVFIGFIIGLVTTLILVVTTKAWDLWRGRDIMRADRETELKEMIAQALTDVMIDLRLEDKMTVTEWMYWRDRLSNVFDLQELLPRGTKTLKERIRLRLATDYKRKPKLPPLSPEIVATKPKPDVIAAEVQAAKKSIVAMLNSKKAA